MSSREEHGGSLSTNLDGFVGAVGVGADERDGNTGQVCGYLVAWPRPLQHDSPRHGVP